MRNRFVLAACALWFGTAALANGSCGYERCFGALAVGAGNQIARTAGHRTVPDATDAAQSLCGETCERVEVFWNSCGVFALSSDGDWSFGWDEMLETAQAKAVAACEAGDGAGCYVREWACSK